MLSSVEQAFVGSDEKRAPLKTLVWEAKVSVVERMGDQQNITCIEKLLLNAF